MSSTLPVAPGLAAAAGGEAGAGWVGDAAVDAGVTALRLGRRSAGRIGVGGQPVARQVEAVQDVPELFELGIMNEVETQPEAAPQRPR